VLPAIVVPANDIDTSGLSLDVELGADWVTAQVEDAEARSEVAARFTGRLSKSGKADVVVRGKIQATILVPCARCLKPVSVPVQTELSLLLKPRAGSLPHEGRVSKAAAARAAAKPGAATKVPKPGPSKPGPSKPGSKSGGARNKLEEYEFGSEEADLDEYDGERVVLDPFIREAILLELPSFPLCSEGCPGIAPSETSAASGSPPGWHAGEDPHGSSQGHGPAADLSFGAPAVRPTLGRANPFEVLRGLMTGGTEGGEADADAGVARRPSPKEVRKVSRQKSRNRPKIKSSIVGRAKK
jgi:uncharacterized protein